MTGRCNPAELWRESGAVSPVIGVVLMLALTVTMMAVAAPLVFSQSNDVVDQQPDVNIAFAYSEDVDLSESDTFGESGDDPAIDADGELRVVFESGESVPARQVNISGAASSGNLADGSFDDDEDITAGTEVSVWVKRGDSVTVIWRSSGGDESAILAEFTIRPDT